MRRRLLANACAAVLLFTLAAPAGSQGQTATQLPVLTGTVRIVEAGDSVAGGMGLECGRRWAMRDWINANPGVHVDFVGSQTSACTHPGADRHEGHGGATIADTASHIAGYLAANPADILILTVGVNDTKASGGYRSAAQMAADYTQLLLNARTAAPNIRILASEVIAPNASKGGAEYAAAGITAQEFNALLPALAAPYGDYVRIAHNGRFVLDQNDGLHPDVVVYLLMAWYNLREIWSWLSTRPPAATDAGVLRYDPFA